MLTPWEKLKIRLAVSVGWSIKGKLAEAIRGFQATEADGVWHLHRAFYKLDDPRRKAILFTHSLEEESHAEEFAHIYGKYSERVMTPASYEREDLYPADDDAWKVFAYVHVGEVDATDRFRYIHKLIDDGHLRRSLNKIVMDEDGHIDLTHDMLIEMGVSEKSIKSELFRVRAQRLWQEWLRTGKRVVDNVATLLLSATYYLVGPLLFLTAKKRLSARRVDYDNNHIKRLT